MTDCSNHPTDQERFILAQQIYKEICSSVLLEDSAKRKKAEDKK
jgi:hypothetical protein